MTAPAQINVEDFIKAVKLSGVAKDNVLEDSLKKIQSDTSRMSNASSVADSLIADDVITKWQANNLLQGKYKNFFLGKYRLLGLIGKGGMGAVYLAEHTMLNRRCAIKVLPGVLAKNQNYIERFMREAQAVAAMDHPNIVRAYDIDKDVNDKREMYYLTMEYVKGRDVEDVVKDKIAATKKPLDYVEAADIIRQCAEGLAYAHQQNIVHRDIKPANMLLTDDGVVKILDMGLARNFDDDEAASLTANQGATYLGTPDYLAPEQAIDCHDVDGRADIYSLGCSMYFLLTGRPPFNEGTIAQRLIAHQSRTPPPIMDQRPDAPQDLIDICDMMMEKQREDRYQTAKEAANALAGWLVNNAGDEWIEKHPHAVATADSSVGDLEELDEEDDLESFEDLADLTAESMQSGIGQVSGIGLGSGIGQVSGIGQARPFGSSVNTKLGPIPGNKKVGKTIGGLPIWAVIGGGAAAALALVGIIVTIVLLASGGSDSDGPIDPDPNSDPSKVVVDVPKNTPSQIDDPSRDGGEGDGMSKGEFVAMEKAKWLKKGWPWNQKKVEQNFLEVDVNKDGTASAVERRDWFAKKAAELKQGSDSTATPVPVSKPVPLPKLGKVADSKGYDFNFPPGSDLALTMTWATKPGVYLIQPSVGIGGRNGVSFDKSGSYDFSELRQEYIVPPAGIMSFSSDFQFTLDGNAPPSSPASVITILIGTTGLQERERVHAGVIRTTSGDYELAGALPLWATTSVPAQLLGVGKSNGATSHWLRLEIDLLKRRPRQEIHAQAVLYSLGANGKGNPVELARQFGIPVSKPEIWDSDYWAVGFSRGQISTSGAQQVVLDKVNVAVHKPHR